jgi:hypothetical protein
MAGFFGNKQNSFDSFPDMRGYRAFIFLKGCEVNEVRKQVAEFNEIYGSDIAYSIEVFSIDGTPWTYIALNLLPNANNSPIWYYLDILLWMSDKADTSFAYAYSMQEGNLPVIAFRDRGNEYGEACRGMANGKYFQASVPSEEVTWGQNVPAQFDYVGHLYNSYGVNVSLV